MLELILTIISVIIFIISVSYLVKQRRKKGITGFKSTLTPICFYLIGVIGILGLWTKAFGILLWSFIIILLFLAAYFTRFLPRQEGNN